MSVVGGASSTPREAAGRPGSVVAEEATNEGAHVGLMRLHALSGQRREALGQYERLREALLEEFGSEPEFALWAT